jgi:hypothetical protein
MMQRYAEWLLSPREKRKMEKITADVLAGVMGIA